MAALIGAARAPDYPAEIVRVISNRADAAGIALAQNAGVQVSVIDHTAYPDRTSFDEDVTRTFTGDGVEIICNAGFMRLHSRAFVEHWQGRQINIHPSLLPLFRGLHPHRQALAAGVRLSGATVHFVTHEMDEGPIIAQAAVPVFPADTEDELAARVLGAEHKLYPIALGMLAAGDVRMEEGRAIYTDHAMPVLSQIAKLL
jgi:phosphoribosylglycinamide formyltransferase-1